MAKPWLFLSSHLPWIFHGFDTLSSKLSLLTTLSSLSLGDPVLLPSCCWFHHPGLFFLPIHRTFQYGIPKALFPLALHPPFGSLAHSLGLDAVSNENNFCLVLTLLFSPGDFHLDAQVIGHVKWNSPSPQALPASSLPHQQVLHLSSFLSLFSACFSPGFPFSSLPPFGSSLSTVHIIFLKHTTEFAIPGVKKKYSLVFCWKPQLFRYYTMRYSINPLSNWVKLVTIPLIHSPFFHLSWFTLSCSLPRMFFFHLCLWRLHPFLRLS